MSEQIWVRSHVERLLQEEWDVCRVSVDEDGDYPFRYGTAACWVAVLDTEPVMVRVFAHAVCGVSPSAKLLKELNEINARSLSAKVLEVDGVVLVSQTVSPIGLTRRVLAQALCAVGGLADDVGVLLAGMFGGSTPYRAEASADEEVA